MPQRDLQFAHDYSDDPGAIVALQVAGTGDSGGPVTDHSHTGTGDGGQFDAANLASGNASDGLVLTADGNGGTAWEAGGIVWGVIPTTIQPDDTADGGSAIAAARIDHRHAIVAAAPTASLTYASTNNEGSSTSFARADHQHAITAYDDASVYPQHLLKSDPSGHLKLVRLTLTDRLRTSLIDSETGTNLILAPAQDLDLQPGGTARVRALPGVRLQSDNYASQTTGWAIGYNGAADFRYIYTDELHAKAFIADLEQALAGGQIISKSVAPISRDFTAPAAGATAYLWVECFQGFPAAEVFQTGDVVMVRTFDRSGGGLSITNCFGTVSAPYFPSPQSDPPEQRWTFTRLSGTVNGQPAAGYMAESVVVKRGALALDFGVSGNGYHEVNAIDGPMGENSPYNQTVKWATHPWYDRTVTTRTGNLKGLFNVAGEYGLYAGTGIDAASMHLRVSNYGVEAHNIPMRLYDGANIAIALEPSANPYIAIGTPIPTGWLTQSGWWAGKSGGVYRQYLGTVSGGDIAAGLKWDGTTLTVKGQIYVTGGDAAKTDLTNVDADTVVGKVNTAGATLIQPGRIRISGSTTLDGWSHPTDTTKIDGGDIYTNSITADKINVGIGGGNLFTDSSFDLAKHTISTVYNCTALTGETLDQGGNPSPLSSRMLIAANYGEHSYGDNYFILSEQIPVKAGEKITWSYWTEEAGGISSNQQFLCWSNGTYTQWSPPVTASWTRVWHTFTVPAGVTWCQLRWGVFSTSGWWIAVDNVQVEYGDYATAWKSNTWSSVLIDGKTILVGTPGSARVEINSSGIEGYSDSTTKQFYLRTSDGRAAFGGGKGVLDQDGMVLSGNETSYNSYNAVRWLTQVDPPGGNELARVAAGRWVFVSPNYYPELRIHANPAYAFGGGLVNVTASKDANNYLQFAMLLTSVDRLITLSTYDGGAQTAKIELKTAGGSGQITIKPDTEIQGNLLATGNIRAKGAYFDVDNNRVVYSRYVSSYFSGTADSTYSSNEQNLLNAIRDCLLWHGLAASS